jgi:hypothetical protein
MTTLEQMVPVAVILLILAVFVYYLIDYVEGWKKND